MYDKLRIGKYVEIVISTKIKIKLNPQKKIIPYSRNFNRLWTRYLNTCTVLCYFTVEVFLFFFFLQWLVKIFVSMPIFLLQKEKCFIKFTSMLSALVGNVWSFRWAAFLVFYVTISIKLNSENLHYQFLYFPIECNVLIILHGPTIMNKTIPAFI